MPPPKTYGVLHMKYFIECARGRGIYGAERSGDRSLRVKRFFINTAVRRDPSLRVTGIFIDQP